MSAAPGCEIRGMSVSPHSLLSVCVAAILPVYFLPWSPGKRWLPTCRECWVRNLLPQTALNLMMSLCVGLLHGGHRNDAARMGEPREMSWGPTHKTLGKPMKDNDLSTTATKQLTLTAPMRGSMGERGVNEEFSVKLGLSRRARIRMWVAS